MLSNRKLSLVVGIEPATSWWFRLEAFLTKSLYPLRHVSCVQQDTWRTWKDKNHQASSQKFRQIIISLVWSTPTQLWTIPRISLTLLQVFAQIMRKPIDPEWKDGYSIEVVYVGELKEGYGMKCYIPIEKFSNIYRIRSRTLYSMIFFSYHVFS